MRKRSVPSPHWWPGRTLFVASNPEPYRRQCLVRCLNRKEESKLKTKRLMLMSCFAAAALITSPAFGEMHKKSMVTSASKAQRMAPRTTQVTPAKRHATMQTTPMYRQGNSSRYTGTRQYAGTRYYGSSRYGATGYYGGSRYYYGGDGWNYPDYNYSYWPYNYSYWPGSSYG